MTVFVNVFAVIWLETQTNMWLKNILHTATPSPNNHRNMQQRIYTSKELQAHFFFFFSPFLTISLAAEQSWGGLAPSGWLMSCRKQRTLVNFKKKKKKTESFRVQTWQWDDDKTADMLHNCSLKHWAPAYRFRLDVGGCRLCSQPLTSTACCPDVITSTQHLGNNICLLCVLHSILWFQV